MVGATDHRVTRPTGVVAVPTTDLRTLTWHPADEHLVGSPGVAVRTRLGDHLVDGPSVECDCCKCMFTGATAWRP